MKEGLHNTILYPGWSENDKEYYSIKLLLNRGWTKTLIDRLLGEEDTRYVVNHWANWSGGKLFSIDRVNLIEQSQTFEKLFLKSAKRRKFSSRARNIILREVIKSKNI